MWDWECSSEGIFFYIPPFWFECGEYPGISSVPFNIVIDLNNVMAEGVGMGRYDMKGSVS
jgi:hypothetical protein